MGQYFQRAVLTIAVMKYLETFADPGGANRLAQVMLGTCAWNSVLAFGPHIARVISIQQSLMKVVLHLL